MADLLNANPLPSARALQANAEEALPPLTGVQLTVAVGLVARRRMRQSCKMRGFEFRVDTAAGSSGSTTYKVQVDGVDVTGATGSVAYNASGSALIVYVPLSVDVAAGAVVDILCSAINAGTASTKASGQVDFVKAA